MNSIAAAALSPPLSRSASLWTGRTLSGLVILFFLLDSAIKLPPLRMHSAGAALLGLGWGEIDTGLLEGPGSCSCLDRRPSRTRWW
jgi:hypothetical protein